MLSLPHSYPPNSGSQDEEIIGCDSRLAPRSWHITALHQGRETVWRRRRGRKTGRNEEEEEVKEKRRRRRGAV